MIGHMEADLDEDDLEEGRLRVAIAFADLAGYARLTVEQGDEAAVGTVERFVEAVAETLPVDARVIKTLGDEVMVVGSDAAALTAWAVGLQAGTVGGRAAAADRHPLRRRRSTATATTSGARSTRPRAWSRARPAARCSSRARSSKPPTACDGAAVRPHRRGAPEGLLRAHRAVHRLRARRSSGGRRGGPRGGPRGRACSPATGRCRGDALRRARLDVPARRRRGAARRRAACARCTSTTACARRPTHDERHCRELCERAGRGARGRAAPSAPPRDGRRRRATCRRGRASCATAPPRRWPRAHGRADRRPATPPATRSRRSSTGSPPRRGGARCSGCRPREGRLRAAAARRDPRADRRLLPQRAACAWREDESNDDERYARTRVRHGLLPALRAVHPAARGERAAHRRAAARGDRAARRARRRRAGAGGESIAIARLRELPAGARAAGRRAPRRGGRRRPTCPQAGERVAELLALGRARRPGGAARRRARRAR